MAAAAVSIEDTVVTQFSQQGLADQRSSGSTQLFIRNSTFSFNAAAGMDAYTLSDRGTWLSFRNKGPLVVLLEGDALLVNRYDVILLNPEKHPVPKQALARRSAQWLLSSEGQAAIGVYMIAGEHIPSSGHDSKVTAK